MSGGTVAPLQQNVYYDQCVIHLIYVVENSFFSGGRFINSGGWELPRCGQAWARPCSYTQLYQQVVYSIPPQTHTNGCGPGESKPIPCPHTRFTPPKALLLSSYNSFIHYLVALHLKAPPPEVIYTIMSQKLCRSVSILMVSVGKAFSTLYSTYVYYLYTRANDITRLIRDVYISGGGGGNFLFLHTVLFLLSDVQHLFTWFS